MLGAISRAWNTDRPLIFLDFEADGPGEPDPGTDRIVQAGFFKVSPQGEGETRTRLVNPGPGYLPIKRTEIHGVTDEMVASAAPFSSMAKSFHDQLIGCDIATYNGNNYDVPLLWEEFFRAGIVWETTEHRLVDVARLWSKLEPRTLSDAVRRFTGKEPSEDMHDAGVDAGSTHDVLRGMIQQLPGAPTSIEDLAKLTAPTSRIGGKECPRIDLAGAIVRNENGDAVFSHKTNRGTLLKEDPGYARWILGKDFPENTKLAIRIELRRIEEANTLQQPLPLN